MGLHKDIEFENDPRTHLAHHGRPYAEANARGCSSTRALHTSLKSATVAGKMDYVAKPR